MSSRNSRPLFWKFLSLGNARATKSRRCILYAVTLVALALLFIVQAVSAKRQAIVSDPSTQRVMHYSWDNIPLTTPDGNSFGNNVVSVAWGDMDGDGDLDLVVGNTLSLGDVNSDGRLDIISGKTSLFSSNQTSQIYQSIVNADDRGNANCRGERAIKLYLNDQGSLHQSPRFCWESVDNTSSRFANLPEAITIGDPRVILSSSNSTNYTPYLLIDRPETMAVGHSRAMFSSLSFDTSPPSITPESNRLTSIEALSIAGPDEIASQGSLATAIQNYDVYTIVQVDGTTAFEQSPTPLDQKEQQLLPGKTAKFAWTFNPKREGEQSILLTIDLRWVPRHGGKEFIERIYSREIVVDVNPQYTTWGSPVQLSTTLYNVLVFIVGGFATWLAQLIAERIKQRQSIVPTFERNQHYEQLITIPRISTRVRPTRCRRFHS